MFSIPYTFANEEESYITMPAFKRFAGEITDLKTTVDRPQMIVDIEAYASQSQEKQEVVEDWLDHILAEGTKEIQVKYLDAVSAPTDFLRNNDYTKGILDELLVNPSHRHISGNKYGENLGLYRYEIEENDGFVNRISLYMCKLLCTHSKTHTTSTSPYPIFVDMYLDKNLVMARSKSKSGIYKYMDEFILEAATSTTAEKELSDAIRHVCGMLGVKTASRAQVESTFKGKLYRTLDKYTKTPEAIVALMKEKQGDIEAVVDLIMKKICGLAYSYRLDVESSVQNMVEKYFSISYKDKSIFTQDREAYPLKLSATDEEDSKVEQIAALEEPLQSKAIFFDNKKMLQKSKMCDGVLFTFKRRNPKYCSPSFNVKIAIKKDFCTFKFSEYTMEEDMQYVLFTVLDSK